MDMPRSATPPHRRGMVAILATMSTARKRLGFQPFCRGFTSLVSFSLRCGYGMCSHALAISLGSYVVYARLRPFQLEADVRPIAFSPWLPNSSVSAASSVLPSELCFPATRVTDGNWELVWIGFCAVCLSGRGTFSHVSHV